MPKKYRIDAKQIEVIDQLNNFTHDNVEEVLAELKNNINISRGGFSIFVNEVPNEKFDFFQDPNLMITRSSNEIDIIYNNTSGQERIEHQSGTTTETQTTSFFINNLVKSPYIKTTVRFPDSTGMFNLIFNKNGNNHYKVRAGWGNGVRLYRVLDGIESLIYHYTNVIFDDNSKTYSVEVRKIDDDIDVRVNGVRFITKSDSILNDVGSILVESVTDTSNKKLYLNEITFGGLTKRA